VTRKTQQRSSVMAERSRPRPAVLAIRPAHHPAISPSRAVDTPRGGAGRRRAHRPAASAQRLCGGLRRRGCTGVVLRRDSRIDALRFTYGTNGRSHGSLAGSGSSARCRDLNGALTSCGDNVSGWSMRPWESVPAIRGAEDPDRHGRMDQPVGTECGRMVAKRLTGRQHSDPKHHRDRGGPGHRNQGHSRPGSDGPAYRNRRHAGPEPDGPGRNHAHGSHEPDRPGYGNDGHASQERAGPPSRAVRRADIGRRACLALILCGVLAACGKKGTLELPEEEPAAALPPPGPTGDEERLREDG
jgi:predicted small lipoprotein YifL